MRFSFGGGAIALIDSPFHSDYKDDGTNVLLDANENAYGPGLALNANGNIGGASSVNGAHPQIDFLGLNRYPDP
jgi:histidinol-phosphate aminotransferase